MDGRVFNIQSKEIQEESLSTELEKPDGAGWIRGGSREDTSNRLCAGHLDVATIRSFGEGRCGC